MDFMEGKKKKAHVIFFFPFRKFSSVNPDIKCGVILE